MVHNTNSHLLGAIGFRVEEEWGDNGETKLTVLPRCHCTFPRSLSTTGDESGEEHDQDDQERGRCFFSRFALIKPRWRRWVAIECPGWVGIADFHREQQGRLRRLRTSGSGSMQAASGANGRGRTARDNERGILR